MGTGKKRVRLTAVQKPRLANGTPVVTERQGDYLVAIAIRSDDPLPPGLREIGTELGVTLHAVQCCLLALRRKGLVTWQEQRSRTLRLTPLGQHFAALIGEIESGAPIREVA